MIAPLWTWSSSRIISPIHARGRHKARVFAAVLGPTAAVLRATLLAAAQIEEALLECDMW
jgi:hypothetical protein